MIFEDDKIKDCLLIHFGFNNVKLTRLSGFYDGNYRVEIGDDKYFLKIYGVDTLSDVKNQIDFMETIYAGGVPVARLLKSKDGSSYFPYESTYAILQSFLIGIHLFEAKLTDELIKDVGGKLGKVHSLSKSISEPERMWKSYVWDLAQFDLVINDLNSLNKPFGDNISLLIKRRVVDWVKHKQDFETTLKKGVIHNDFHGYNLLVSGNACTGITDFGDSLYSWYLADLAIALVHICFQDKRRIQESVRAFLQGYRFENPQLDFDPEQLLILMGLRPVTILVEYATHFDVVPDGIYKEFEADALFELEYLDNEANRLALMKSMRL